MPISFAARGILPPSPVADITTGLIANWPMQFISGGTLIVDNVGTLGVNATIVGGIGLTLATGAGPGGLLPNAVQTDGTGVAHYATSTLRDWTTGSFSIAGWFYFGDLGMSPGGAGTENQRVWSDDRIGSDATNNIDIRNGGASNGRMSNQTCNINTFHTTTGDYTAGFWHHFAMSNAGGGAGGTISIFFDGARVTPISTGTGGGNWGSAQANFFSGDLAGNGLMNNGGRLCGMRCYNRVLADMDVLKLFTDKT